MALENPLAWTPEAQARLQQVPEGVMRDLTRQRVEVLARQRGQPKVTVDLLEAKYHQWSEGSARVVSESVWTDDARERVERIPPFVRGMAVEAIEAYARQQGLAEITPATVDEAKGSWGQAESFHHPS